METLYNFSGSLVSRDFAAEKWRPAVDKRNNALRRCDLESGVQMGGLIHISWYLKNENHIVATLKKFLLHSNENQP